MSPGNMPFLSWTTQLPFPRAWHAAGTRLSHTTLPSWDGPEKYDIDICGHPAERKNQLYHELYTINYYKKEHQNINHPCIADHCSMLQHPYGSIFGAATNVELPQSELLTRSFRSDVASPRSCQRDAETFLTYALQWGTKTHGLWNKNMVWFVMVCPTKQIMVQHFFHIKQKQEFWFVQHRGRDLQCLWITVLSLAPVWLPSQQTKRKPTVGALSFLKKCSIVLALGCLHFTIWLAESETSWLVGCDHQSPKSTISWMLYHDPSAHLRYCFVIMTFVICLQLPWLHGSILARDDSIASPSSKRGQSQRGTTRWPVLIAYLSPSPSQIWT